MKSSRASIISAGLVVLAGSIAATLWLELATARKSTAGLRNELAEAYLRHHAQMEAARAAAALGPAPAPRPTPEASPFSQSTSRLLELTIADPRFNREASPIPDVRQSRLATVRASIPQAFPGLADELALTGEEADQVFDLLAAREADARSPSDQHGDALRTLLGEARYAQWQAYVPTRLTRVRAASFATELAQLGAPMNSVQQKALVGAMLDEERALERDIIRLGRMVDPADPASRLAAQEALSSRRGEGARRILDSVSASLTSQQLSLLAAQIEQRAAIEASMQQTRNQREGLGK